MPVVSRSALPAELVRPFDPQLSYADRINVWKRWETEQWVAAITYRELSILSVEPEIQTRILARIDERGKT